LPKLTASQRQEVKHWIKVCRVRGLSLQATRETVNRQLPDGFSLSMIAIQKYITLIKVESKNWIDNMALDAYEFVYELKQRWDELQELKRCEWEMLDDAKKQGDIETQLKAALVICKTNREILEMNALLPQIAIPSPSSPQFPNLMQKLEPKNGKGKQQELDWKNDPSFAGMPGHNLDENFQPRQKPVYHDPDFDDQP